MAGVIAAMAGLALCYALVARRLTEFNITAPMLSVLAGLALFPSGHIDINAHFVHVMAEVTLVLILFHDASAVRVARLRRDPGIALRLLVIGFPLALLSTFAVGTWLLPGVGLAGALLIAAAITPTDAGLAASTVLNPVVPLRVRRALNVESGLNDGLATPIVLIALGILAESQGAPVPRLLGVGTAAVLLALLVAVLPAWLAAKALDASCRHGLSGRRGRQVATAMVPVLLFGVSDVVGANAFIAAFVAGLVFGAASATMSADHDTADLLETASDLMGFVVWFFFGGLLLVVLDDDFDWRWMLLAVLALTVLRIAPVAVAMIGTGFRWQTVAFLGWFGPRGLATIVFGLLTLNELGPHSPRISTINGVLSMTVLLSVFVHGFSAGPLGRVYGRWVERTHPPISLEPADERIATRGRPVR